MKIAKDMAVKLKYRAEGRAFEYLHGYGTLVLGLEKALEGHETGDAFQVSVEPEEAYGLHDPSAVVAVPRNTLDPAVELVEGNMVETNGPYGRIELMIVKFDEETVWLDANHPLAGLTLHFDVTVGPIREAHPDEIKHRQVHPGGHHLMVSDSSYLGEGEGETADEGAGRHG